MSPKIIHFVALSLIFHGLLIFVLVSVKTSNSKLQVKPKPQSKPIASYLIVEKAAAVSEIVNDPEIIPPEVTEQAPQQSALSVQINTQRQNILQPETQAKSSVHNQKVPPAEPLANKPSQKTQTRVSQYFQNLHANELKKLAENASEVFNKPNPIGRSTPLSTNQRLKALSSTFAAPGSNILVMSTFGSDETNVILGDACFTITQTALDDKVSRGASVWKRSNKCGSYDKFDGQLQRSLDKYLQK